MNVTKGKNILRIFNFLLLEPLNLPDLCLSLRGKTFKNDRKTYADVSGISFAQLKNGKSFSR